MMIYYHGGPMGGTRDQGARFYRGRHAFVSFARPEDLPIVAEVAQSFSLDNGAFSIWRKGGELDFSGYTDWCREWAKHPGFDWAVIPDVIDGTTRENDEWVGLWPSDIPGVPVWHLHEPIQRLLILARGWPRIAIGSSGDYSTPGTTKWWGRIGEAMSAICDPEGRPITRIHGLRMLNPDLFSKLPLASADSCNATINAGSLSRFGIYKPPTAAQRAEVIAARIESFNSAPNWSGSAIQGEMWTWL